MHWGISVNAKAQQKMIVIRAILTVICFAGGFVVPLLFLLAAFFASTIYNIVDPKPDPPVDAW
ncbi:Na+/proline symporter [Rhizobium ruizarguesonis]